jgi:hypothetical protein
MVTIIKTAGVFSVIALRKGEAFFVKYMIPEGVENFIEGEPSSSRKIAKMRVVAVVEGLHASGMGCKHMRFIRADRAHEGVESIDFVTPKAWPKLRVALKHANVPTTHVAGGFDNAVAYNDEVAVPDYSMSGSRGWIVQKREIGRYLDALPPLQDSGEVGTLWIDHVGWMNTPDECAIRIVDHDPSGEEAPSYYDRPRSCRMSENRQIFRVEYDRGSRLVKRIVHLHSEREQQAVGYAVHPGQRSLVVGKRVPQGLAA